MSLLSTLAIFGATLYLYFEPSLLSTAVPRIMCGAGFESLQLGCSLAHKGTFSDPFQVLETGPSAHMAPMFPAFVAVLIRFFGENSGLAVVWAAILVLGSHLAVLPLLAKHMGLSMSAGVLAAIAFLVAKIPLYPMWESLYVGLLAVCISFLMYDLVAGRSSLGKLILAAVLWGILTWTNPAPLFVMLAWLAWICIGTNLPRDQKLVVVIIPFLVVSPWLARNYSVFRHFVFMRDNLGLELAVSNNPCSAFWFKANEFSECFGENHPNKSVVEAEKVRTLGEYEYNRVRGREALEWIRINRGRFLALTGQRFVAFWFPSVTGNPWNETRMPAGLLLIWFMALLSVPGVWLMWKENPKAAGIVMLWLFMFPPVYYIIQFDVRYRYPILWATFLPASFFVREMGRAVWQTIRPR